MTAESSAPRASDEPNLLSRVTGAWLGIVALVYCEVFLVLCLRRDFFVGGFELGAALGFVAPIGAAVGFLVACAVGVSAPYLLDPLRGGHASPRSLLDGRGRIGLVAGLLGGVFAYGISFGRHFENVPVRVAFVGLFALAAGGIKVLLAGPTVRYFQERPRQRRAALGAGIVALVLADRFLLPRLYPAFHGFLGAGALLLASGLFRSVQRPMVARAIASIGLILCALAPVFAKKLAGYDNVRVVFAEQSPLGGKWVTVAGKMAPADAEVGNGTENVTATVGASNRSLDFTGADIVLISIDALRADHLGAYGYPRKTSPNIDALAREGVRFERAYCPTPHTSYSVTSMMTGKYLRPLLALDLGSDSETFADLLRRYDYRTAAFYPPAVFFIDGPKFTSFQERRLGFEYAKVEFAGRELREKQLDSYLAKAPKDHPLFLWLHAFEPHEPYEVHPEHRFGDPTRPTDVDAYDSEIAEADALVGAAVAKVRATRPNAVVIVTADHGEEFGDHGGRYHGTSVYEEQVRVPLIIVAPKLSARVVSEPVQTIDLLPTVLSALGVPRPSRLRGRDLGPLLIGKAAEPTWAFAETEDDAMVARGTLRLLCKKEGGACALYDLSDDPEERKNRVAEATRATDLRGLRALSAAIQKGHGALEGERGAGLPEALRRCVAGDADAATDAAALLEDAKRDVRLQAADCLFDLAASDAKDALRLAAERDEDPGVSYVAAAATLRSGGDHLPRLDEALQKGDGRARFLAALALAETSDRRGEETLAAALAEPSVRGLSFKRLRDAVRASGKIKSKQAVPALISLLADVRIRGDVAQALEAAGDARARESLAQRAAEERHVELRAPLLRALLAVGGAKDAQPILLRFSGLPEPLFQALALADAAGLLAAPQNAAAGRIVLTDADAVTVHGTPIPLSEARVGDSLRRGTIPEGAQGLVTTGGKGHVWVVAPTVELAPPPPVPWDAGPEDEIGVSP